MDDIFIAITTLFLLLVVLAAFVLPITALVIAIRSKRKLNQRLANLEAAHGLPTAEAQASLQQLNVRIQRLEAILFAKPAPSPQVVEEPRLEKKPAPAPPPPQTPIPTPTTTPARAVNELESMIGRRLVGYAAILLILFAAAFFLKYAFDNRWIGEVGRVAIGIAAGVLMTSIGFKYFKRGWRVFSQILTGGGVVLLYLSAYAAFGYYHLVPQKAAVAFLAILIAEAATLALLYNAPSIAIMALIGGFLTPLLLHSDRDQHLAFFGYLIAIDLGALALLKRWRGLRTLAFIGTHLLFWVWYDHHYHEQKFAAVVVFQLTVFLIFLAAHISARLLGRLQSTSLEDIWLIAVNPFVFFATAYHLLNPLYHDWMGVFAIAMALLYAGATKLLLDRTILNRAESLSLIGIALTFVTVAIPVQLRSNWITIAWAIEALTMLWVGIETKLRRLHISACALFVLALGKLLFWDTPLKRPMFTPVFNRYVLSSLLVIGCLFGAASLYHTLAERRKISTRLLKLVFLLAAVIALWWVSSIEIFTFFNAKAIAQRIAEDARHQRWLGQMVLSVVWAVYAAGLAAVGFVRRSSATRWASLALFALTILKAMLIDIARLQQLYRIIVFFVLGVLLLLVAWGYHKAFQARESST